MGCICAADLVEVEGDAARHLSEKRATPRATLRHAAPMSRPKSASVMEATMTAVTPTPTWSAWVIGAAGWALRVTAGLPGLQHGLQSGLQRGADAHRARRHVHEAQPGGVPG